MNPKYLITSLLFLIFASCLSGQEQKLKTIVPENKWIKELDQNIDSILNDYSLSWEEVEEGVQSLSAASSQTYGDSSLSKAFVLHKLGVVAYMQDKYESAIDYYSRALEVRKIIYQKQGLNVNTDIVRGLYNIGACHYYNNNPGKALDYLNEALDSYYLLDKKGKDILLQQDILLHNARAYKALGDHDNALRYFETATKIESAVDPSNNSNKSYLVRKARALIELGGLLANDLDLMKRAMRPLSKGIEILTTKISNGTLEANAYHNFGVAYEKEGDYSQAIQAYQKAILINKDKDRKSALLINFNNIGIAYLKSGNLNEAKKHLLSGKDLIIKELKDVRYLDLIYDNLGDIAVLENDLALALDYYKKAINIHYFSDTLKPDSSHLFLQAKVLYDKMGLLTSLASKAKTLAQIGGAENESQALFTYHQVDTLVNLIRQDFQAEASKANLAKRIKPIYEQAIELCYQLYQNNPDQKDYLKQAFTFSEKSRSLILLEAVRGIKAGAQLSEEVYQTMAAIDLQRNYYEKQLQLSQTNPKRDESEVQENREALIRARLRKDSLLAAIEAADPAYFQLKYSKEVADMEMVQQSLEPDQSLLEYFVGRDAIYAFVINQERPAQFIKIAKDFPLQQWVQQLSREIDQKSQNFFSTSHQLYQAIFQALEGSLNKKLIIISDDILGHLSFELLYSKNMETNRVYYRDLKDYLLHQYQISYSYSASMVLETSNRKNSANRNMLAVAPAFSKNVQVNQVQFSPLQWNQDLAKSSAALFSKNKLLLEQEDNIKDDFLQKAGNYSILQLATHAVANDSLGDLSFILFGAEASDALYAKDLYTTPLQAEMVVLSACQGALGELQTGEGIISLARAFIYAGAKSVIPTLWSVEDETTKDLTLTFYQHIKSGQNKDEALRQAKLDYLDQLPGELDHKAHPYYWGAFVAVGEMDSIKSQKSLLPWVLAFIAILVLGLLYLNNKRST